MRLMNVPTVGLIALFAGIAPVMAGSVSIDTRQSQAGIRVFAGVGPDVDLLDVDDDTASPTGPFSFSQSHDAFVNRTEEPGVGSSEASGTNVSSDLVSLSGSELFIESHRTWSGSAEKFSGTANATSSAESLTEVYFFVNDDQADFTLTGSFLPAANTNASLILVGTDGQGTAFNYSTTTGETATPNISGTLDTGRWRFRLRMFDNLNDAATGAGPISAASSFDLQLTVTSIPEPSIAAGLVAMTGSLLLRRKPDSLH